MPNWSVSSPCHRPRSSSVLPWLVSDQTPRRHSASRQLPPLRAEDAHLPNEMLGSSAPQRPSWPPAALRPSTAGYGPQHHTRPRRGGRQFQRSSHRPRRRSVAPRECGPQPNLLVQFVRCVHTGSPSKSTRSWGREVC